MGRVKTQKNEPRKHQGLAQPGRYKRFKLINGEHPLQDEVPGSFVKYRVRTRHGGKVAFFNFDLAKEMGLIPLNHTEELNSELEKEILHTFGIIIINEYDIINNIEFPEEDIREHSYMATRYLQLQHPNKQGKTSGDGRSIWNGCIGHNGKTFDISSCGTGATCLSPATHLQKRYFQSGDPSISYGCGYSEIDEGLSTLFFSEVFHKNQLATERVLAIIEYPKGIAINVRAHEGLLRPSHMFAQLKQGNFETLKQMVDYYINRQASTGAWRNVPSNKKARYQYFLDRQTEVFAKMAARFEDDYIFCWLDWDGDNILMDGGVIDYGSIRQFGLFHHEYRFDDVQRFSTTILEQKNKARYIVQNFAQIADFLANGKKKNISYFSKHKSLKRFDKIFEESKDRNFIAKLGFIISDQDFLLNNFRKEIQHFRKVFSYFERAKSVKGKHKVADGINWSAIFCMRDILRELPQIYLSTNAMVSDKEFVQILKSNYATKADLKINLYRSKQIRSFQKFYMKLVDIVAHVNRVTRQDVLLDLSMRSSVINKYDRVTGDSITHVAWKIINMKPRPSAIEIYNILKEFAEYQNLDPDTKLQGKNTMPVHGQHLGPMKGLLRIVRDCREGL